MTETRKKLVQLLEPYMEKELDVWSIIEYNNKLGLHQIFIKEWDFFYIKPLYYNWWILIRKKVLEKEINEKLCKNIWHYDISAVFKYIYNSWKVIMNNDISIYEKEIFLEYKQWMKMIKILNKPLHVYTEDEEKDLLKRLSDLINN